MALFDVLLLHRCTRTPYTAGTEDAWGMDAGTAGAAVTGVLCFYNPADKLVADPEGRVTLSVPTLLVEATSPLAVNDRVSALVNSAGVSLTAGTFVVESIVPLTLIGPTVLKRAVLKAAEVVR